MLAAAVLALRVVRLLQPQAGESTGKQPATTSTRPTATDTPATMTSATPAANAIPASSPTIPRISPAGWCGNWSSPSGAYLKFDLDLSESGGSVSGQINWTLLRTSRPDKQSKIGSSAIEYVSGTFNPETREVTMRGTSKSDPNNMLVMLDQYRLNLSSDGRTLNGAAKNGGKWGWKSRS